MQNKKQSAHRQGDLLDRTFTEEEFPERFTGVWRLYGKQAFRHFAQSRICVIGLGGVGSWAAEALARSGIGHITLVDPDVVVATNLNRQIQALENNIGKNKALALAMRVKAINPDCRVTVKAERLTPYNIAEFVGKDSFDYVVEAIDDITAKAALIAYCRKNAIPQVTSGGAGGQTDPTRIVVSDLGRTVQDPLLARLRSRLRQKYGFPRGTGAFGIAAVYSTEQVKYPGEPAASALAEAADNDGDGAVRASAYGTTVVVTASFGMTVAAVVLQHLADAASGT